MKNSRRWFLRAAATISGAVVAACRGKSPATDQQPSLLGGPVSPYGERSPYEKPVRLLSTRAHMEEASSKSPLGDLHGMITPPSLHFERHHSGVPKIDPAQHELLIHGLVERPLIFRVDELKRLPSISRIYFLECSGNSNTGWRPVPQPSAQAAHGMTSCSNWTGVPLAILFKEAGIKPEGKWFVAEGADACKMTRSIPIEKAWDDALIAYAQNGEALRPEQGYPIRLLLPGWEGNSSVKWVRQIKVVDQPVMSREETSKYTDLLADGRSRQFTFRMEAKSVITRPSAGQRLPAAGFYEVTGIAWSGNGAITRVEISTDGGATWTDATLQAPVLPKAHTRFTLPWTWDGREVVLVSRCTDDTGYVQPSRAELVAVRGLNSNYHCNATQGWKVNGDGTVVDAAL